MKNKGMLRSGAVALPLLVGLAATGAQAAGVLEEVIVTATLRAESLQDVPVSVNALSGEKMMEAGIDKVEDLQAYVPNLTMSETGIGTNIYVRGIGSGINQGFEQSVGMYFDGVSYGRAQLSRAPFLDLARVEV
ncbi:MAG: iron complex outermembrane receptor protein, partial [Paracoccaceae bacterium]